MTEAKIEHEIRKVLGAKPDLVLYRNQVGAAKQKDNSYVTYGLCPGSSDLIGILAPTGRFFALEVKGPRGKRSDKQKLFQRLIRRMGGFAATVKSIEEAVAAYQRAREGATQ